MYYTPQPIAVHTAPKMQNFRRGECGVYANIVLYDAPDFIMPNICIKRAVSGAVPTVVVCDLNDTEITELTPVSATSYPLDDEGEFEMLVLEGGNWPGLVSLMSGQYYYMRIDAGVFSYYTDELIIQYQDGTFPEACGETLVKLSWSVNGDCIVSGVTAANPASPVYTYPMGETLDFYLFWRANLSRPEWDYEEQGEEDAHGVVQKSSQRLEKRWTLEGMPVSERIADAITSCTLGENVTIEMSDGTVFSGITNIKTEIGWNNGGCNATVQMKFTTDYLLKQGCC